MSFYSRGRQEPGFPRLSGSPKHVDRSLTNLEDEIERLVNNRSAPPAAGEGSPYRNAYGKGMPSKKIMQDLHDQVKLYQKEVEKKDKLIQELSRSDPEKRHVTIAPPGYSHESFYRNAKSVDYNRNELSLLQHRNEQLETELKELKGKFVSCEVQLREAEADNDRFKDDNHRQNALIHTLKQRVEELQTVSVSNGEHALNSLQQDARQQQERIFELESRIRNLTDEREEAEQKTQSWQRKFGEITLHLQRTMSVEEEEPETLVEKIKMILSENLTLKGKLATLEESLSSTELESKASRETIQRLVNELDREQKTYLSNATLVEKMKLKSNEHQREKERLADEIKLLRDRLDSNENAWLSKKHELDSHHSTVSSLNQDIKTAQFEAQVANSELKALKESLAGILGDRDLASEPHGDVIKERVKQLRIEHQEQEGHVDGLRSQIKLLTEQVENQSTLHQAALQRAKNAELQSSDFKSRMRLLEDGLSSSDALRDGMKVERQKYMAFLQKMANIMGMDEICHDLGFDMNGDTLLARAEQLMRREGDTIVDKSSHVYTLQRKLKTLKQQLESKDLHLDLMRKKIAALEEGMAGRTNIQREKEDYEFSYKKLIKENDRLRGDLGDAKKIILELKSGMLNVSNLKLSSYSQKSEIEELIKKVEQLEKAKEKQARKLAGMKHELEYSEEEANQSFQKAEQTVMTLSAELKTTKALLAEIQHREHQLQDFRQVIARMLGLDVSVLAIPDYEIISKLEKLIQAHHSNTITTLGLEHSLGNMERGFRQGYTEASSLLGSMPKTKIRSPSPARKKVHHPQVY
ncbi:coiled-coil domain-containing protein 170-like [Apostichopus japonicus]|uniref:coiled-coil domain-containing protein 170-like n=1 Tax=Stichopus japonicus TaxID=307972 RepID=UPI003AB8BD85